MEQLKLPIIGRSASIDLRVDQKMTMVPARIDTGAYTSAIWASDMKVENGQLYYVLFDKQSSFYTGEIMKTDDFSVVSVKSSFGDRQARYAVWLTVRLPNHGNSWVSVKFTLGDRSKKRYPILIGRHFLANRYVVDVRYADSVGIIDEEFKNKGETQ